MTSFASHPNLRYRIEAAALLVLACAFLVVGNQQKWFVSADRALYDAVISRVAAPRDPNVVIVSIDDAALHLYGLWPWPRALQARLWERIQAYDPSEIAVDIVFTGPESDGQIANTLKQGQSADRGDARLVAAAQQIESLALPLMIEPLGAGQQYVELLPFPQLLAETDHLGHVHVHLDADAIVRGTWLYQGVGSAHWPHLMLTLSESSTHPGADCPGRTASNARHVVKCEYVRFPFAGPAETYPWIPASLLLQENLDDQLNNQLSKAINSKTVMVGLTASGAGDWVTSPTSGEGSPMPGVEFNANLLSALRSQTLISQPANAALLLIALIMVSACSLMLPRLEPKQMLITSVAMAVMPILITIAALRLSWTHLPLAGASITILLLYPLWSWRRHEIALAVRKDRTYTHR